MSIVRIIETDPGLHFSQETDTQTPLAVPEPPRRDEIRAAVERGHALRATYIGEAVKNAFRRIGDLADSTGNHLCSEHITAHNAR